MRKEKRKRITHIKKIKVFFVVKTFVFLANLNKVNNK